MSSPYPSANFLISSNHLTMAFALFFPKLIQCQFTAGSGLSTTGIRRTGLPLNSVNSGLAVAFSSLGISVSSFIGFSGPDFWPSVTPQRFYAGSGLAGVFSSLGISVSSFFSLSAPDFRSSVTPQRFYAGSGFA